MQLLSLMEQSRNLNGFLLCSMNNENLRLKTEKKLTIIILSEEV